MELIGNYLLYVLKLVLLSLGTILVSGFAVRLFERIFSMLTGSKGNTVFQVTAAIGTPVHELGHAIMCLLFGHKITGMQLWSPSGNNGTGVYGYVEHSYNPRNPWARLGNLFIGVGPIFSGLGVIVLTLFLCFPAQWSDYLAVSRELAADGRTVGDLFNGVLSLFASLPEAFREAPLRAIIGALIILPVSMHVSLSPADVKGAASAMPIYFGIAAIFGLVTSLLKLTDTITAGLWLFNLRLLSIFILVIAFSALWVVLALLVKLIRLIISLFR